MLIFEKVYEQPNNSPSSDELIELDLDFCVSLTVDDDEWSSLAIGFIPVEARTTGEKIICEKQTKGKFETDWENSAILIFIDKL